MQGAVKVFALSLHDSNIEYTKHLELIKYRLYEVATLGRLASGTMAKV